MKERTLAKELIIGGKSLRHQESWEKEFAANAFAEELLMPEEAVLERFRKVFVKTGFNGPMTVRILAKVFGVEFYLMMKRLTHLKAL